MKKVVPGVRSGEASRSTFDPTGLPLLLYIEDDPNNWALTELQLRRRYRLVRAATDREACALLVELKGELYAILMDIQLQGSQLDGIDLTRLLRGRLAPLRTPEYARAVEPTGTPVIFVTAGVGAYPEQGLLDAGGDAVIRKPVDFTQLGLALAALERKPRSAPGGADGER